MAIPRGLVKALIFSLRITSKTSKPSWISSICAPSRCLAIPPARLISEDVGPERTTDIAAAFTRQVEQEANGWASEEDLQASLKKSNSKTPEAILAAYAHFGSKKRADGRIEWKRDPALAKGFVPTELWRFVEKIQCPTLYVMAGLAASFRLNHR
jgi:hypothetical protein